MERSGNFYKAIRLGYILISILIGCMVKMFGQGNIRRWREKGLVEPVSKRPGKIEYRVSDLRILQQRKQDLCHSRKRVEYHPSVVTHQTYYELIQNKKKI